MLLLRAWDLCWHCTGCWQPGLGHNSVSPGPGPWQLRQSQCPLISPALARRGSDCCHQYCNKHSSQLGQKAYRLTVSPALYAAWLSFVHFRASSIPSGWREFEASGCPGCRDDGCVSDYSFLWCKFYEENVNLCSLFLAVCGILYDTGRCLCCYHHTNIRHK